jgi:hypothetical protein
MRRSYDLNAMLAFEPFQITHTRLALERCPRHRLFTRLRLWWELRRLRRYYEWIGK